MHASHGQSLIMSYRLLTRSLKSGSLRYCSLAHCTLLLALFCLPRGVAPQACSDHNRGGRLGVDLTGRDFPDGKI